MGSALRPVADVGPAVGLRSAQPQRWIRTRGLRALDVVRTCQRPAAARSRKSLGRACGPGRRSARGPSCPPGAAAARAAGRRCAARRARPRRSRSATAPRSTIGSGAAQATCAVSTSTSLSAALAAVARTASADQSVASTRPPASAAAMLGRPRPQPSSSTRAPRSERPGHVVRQRHAARPQLGPVGEELLVLEALLGEQRLGVARAGQRHLADRERDPLLDRVDHVVRPASSAARSAASSWRSIRSRPALQNPGSERSTPDDLPRAPRAAASRRRAAGPGRTETNPSPSCS